MPTEQQIPTSDAWDGIAHGYDEFTTPSHGQLSEEAVRRAGVGPGTRFLDVAAGSGALSIPAARLGAHVVATDFSPVMIERLSARIQAEGLNGVDTRVMDGHALEFDDETFDVSGSQFGVMLFPDLPRGLREMARVTRSGGKVLVVAFGPPTRVEFLSFFIGAIQATVPGFSGLPQDPPPLPFQVADADVLRARMADAGLTGVDVATIDHPIEFRSADHMWEWVTHSNPIGAGMVADLTDRQRADVKEVLDGMLRERSGGSGPAVLHHAVNVAIGSR